MGGTRGGAGRRSSRGGTSGGAGQFPPARRGVLTARQQQRSGEQEQAGNRERGAQAGEAGQQQLICNNSGTHDGKQ